jgi:hypothetical protein
MNRGRDACQHPAPSFTTIPTPTRKMSTTMHTSKIGQVTVVDVCPITYKLEYTRAEVAGMLGVTVDAIDTWLKAELLIGMRRSGVWKVPHLDLVEFCAKHEAYWPVLAALKRAQERADLLPHTGWPLNRADVQRLCGIGPQILSYWTQHGLETKWHGERVTPAALEAFLSASELCAPILERYRANTNPKGELAPMGGAELN